MTAASQEIPFSCGDDQIYPYLLGVVYRQVRCQLPPNTSREDLAQNAACAWLEARARYDPSKDPKGLGPDSWGRYIARLSITRALGKRSGSYRDYLLQQRTDEYVGFLEDRPSTSPDFIVERRRLLATLREKISQLPPQEREVVLLHHIQGEGVGEIAQRLNRSEDAVKSLLYRGRKHLEECFKR